MKEGKKKKEGRVAGSVRVRVRGVQEVQVRRVKAACRRVIRRM